VGRAAEAACGEVVTLYEYDESAGQTIITRAQDVEPIFEENALLYTMNDGYSPSRELRRVAQIPQVIAEDWYREGVDIFDKNCRDEVRRRLNDPANLKLRTAPGRV
jgi:hypothetical protein